MSGPAKVAVRLAWAVLGMLVGSLLGRFSGWFVWNYIYGIGGRVISDETYAALENDVCFWSMVAGAGTGLLAGFVLANRSVGVLFAQHLAGVAAGMFFASEGWQVGLLGYGLGQLVGIVAALIVLAALRVARR